MTDCIEVPPWPRKQPERNWHDIPEAKRCTNDATDHLVPIPMRSQYFAIRKRGVTSYLKKQMLDQIIGGELCMVRSYNWRGRDQKKVVQMTCDDAVERDLSEMRKGGVKKLQPEYNPLHSHRTTRRGEKRDESNRPTTHGWYRLN